MCAKVLDFNSEPLPYFPRFLSKCQWYYALLPCVSFVVVVVIVWRRRRRGLED